MHFWLVFGVSSSQDQCLRSDLVCSAQGGIAFLICFIISLADDLTNTYFEGRKVSSELAAFGRSKEKRSDCKLVVLALVGKCGRVYQIFQML